MWFSQPNANWTINLATGRPDDPIACIPIEPTLDAAPLRSAHAQRQHLRRPAGLHASIQYGESG
jgi:hypothetical protein